MERQSSGGSAARPHLSRAIGGLEERGEGVVLAVRRPRRGRSSVVVAAAAFVPGRSLLRLGQLKALVKQAPRDSDSASRQLRLDAGACQELPPHEGVDALVAPGRVLRDRQELARPFGPSRIQEQRQNRASHQLVLRPALGRHETSLLIEEDEEREQGLRGGGFRYVSPDLVALRTQSTKYILRERQGEVSEGGVGRGGERARCSPVSTSEDVDALRFLPASSARWPAGLHHIVSRYFILHSHASLCPRLLRASRRPSSDEAMADLRSASISPETPPASSPAALASIAPTPPKRQVLVALPRSPHAPHPKPEKNDFSRGKCCPAVGGVAGETVALCGTNKGEHEGEHRRQAAGQKMADQGVLSALAHLLFEGGALAMVVKVIVTLTALVGLSFAKEAYEEARARRKWESEKRKRVSRLPNAPFASIISEQEREVSQRAMAVAMAAWKQSWQYFTWDDTFKSEAGESLKECLVSPIEGHAAAP